MPDPITSGSTTPNMGLVKWDSSTDAYSHTQLATNFTTLDNHNHTPGKGVPIGLGGLSAGIVGSTELAAGAIESVHIQDGAIGVTNLSAALLTALQPVGSVIQWWRPTSSVALPAGWVPIDGRTLTAGNHSFPVVGSVTLPDMRNRFVLGADTANTGTVPTTPPVIGAVGGAQTRDLRHVHQVLAHDHGGETEAFGGATTTQTSVSTSTAAPQTDVQGGHHHKWQGYETHLRAFDKSNGSDHLAFYIPGFGNGTDDTQFAMDDGGDHSHTVAAHAHDIPAHAHFVFPHQHPIDPDTPMTSFPADNPPKLTATTDLRPAYVGLLFLMKVMY